MSEEREVEVETEEHPFVPIQMRGLSPGDTSWYQEFLIHYVENGGNLERTCAALGIPVSTVYRHMAKRGELYEAYQSIRNEARLRRIQRLQDEIYDRALDPKDKQSHLLLMFEMKALLPLQYREVPIIVRPGEQTMQLGADLRTMSPDELDKMEARLLEEKAKREHAGQENGLQKKHG